MNRQTWFAPLLLVLMLFPLYSLAQAGPQANAHLLYLFSGGLPADANGSMLLLWYAPLALTTAYRFDEVKVRSHGFYLQRLLRSSRQQYFFGLYARRLLGQTLIFALAIAATGLFWVATHPQRGAVATELGAQLPGALLSLLCFAVLVTLHYLLMLCLEPVIAYLLTNGYMIVSLSLVDVNYRQPAAWLFFPNAMMNQRIRGFEAAYGWVLLAAMIVLLFLIKFFIGKKDIV